MSTTNKRFIIFDVMLLDRFIATLRFPCYLADDYVNGRFVASDETLMKFTEEQLPTLKGKPFNICF